jgi:citrate synthase
MPEINTSPTTTATAHLAVQDSRTGKTYELPIREGAIRATDLRQIKTDPKDFGLMSYDPGFVNTAACRSAITFIDGEAGKLWYRGYPIEELAESVSFLEVAYLLLHGELPTADQLQAWTRSIQAASTVPEGIIALVRSFPRDAHPMSMLLSAVGALGAYYPEAKAIQEPEQRQRDIRRLIAVMPVLAGLIYRQTTGREPRVFPATGNYARDLLTALFAEDASYAPDPRVVRAMDVLLILHADHEQNCSTNTVRGIGSADTDPYSCIAGGVAALYGPLHGGANEAVLRMLHQIETVDHVPGFVERVKRGERRLMGFGHRVYKNYDPRARIIKRTAEDVFAAQGMNPLLDVAVALEKVALEDPYFIERKLYPNVDFYSGLIYEALGLPPGMFTVIFAVARTSGWLAQWQELVEDEEQKIARPRQIYIGPGLRHVPPRR